MKLWRIATETRRYAATDLSGAGAAQHPGRWNDEQQPVVYCATSIALAVLETAAHVDAAGLPQNRFLIEINVPDPLWAQREELTVAQLPPTWAAIPAGMGSVQLGSRWLSANRSPVLLLPSVIVPEEFVALLNPRHANANLVTARVIRSFDYSGLFRG